MNISKHTWLVNHTAGRLCTHNFSANALTAPSVGQREHWPVRYNKYTTLSELSLFRNTQSINQS